MQSVQLNQLVTLSLSKTRGWTDEVIRWSEFNDNSYDTHWFLKQRQTPPSVQTGNHCHLANEIYLSEGGRSEQPGLFTYINLEPEPNILKNKQNIILDLY